MACFCLTVKNDHNKNTLSHQWSSHSLWVLSHTLLFSVLFVLSQVRQSSHFRSVTCRMTSDTSECRTQLPTLSMLVSLTMAPTPCSGLIKENGSSRGQQFLELFPGWKQCCLVSVLWVLVVLVVSRVVGGQWWSVYPRVVEGTITLVPAASLHHKVTTHRPLGHVWRKESQ